MTFGGKSCGVLKAGMRVLARAQRGRRDHAAADGRTGLAARTVAVVFLSLIGLGIASAGGETARHCLTSSTSRELRIPAASAVKIRSDHKVVYYAPHIGRGCGISTYQPNTRRTLGVEIVSEGRPQADRYANRMARATQMGGRDNFHLWASANASKTTVDHLAQVGVNAQDLTRRPTATATLRSPRGGQKSADSF